MSASDEVGERRGRHWGQKAQGIRSRNVHVTVRGHCASPGCGRGNELVYINVKEITLLNYT